MNVKNAKSLPERFYGLHFAEGVAHYPEHKATIFIGSKTARSMDSTYSGKPLFVRHRDEYSLDNIEQEADGWVVRSFYNQADGKHWAELLVISDAAKDAIARGWRLSNSYNIINSGAGGVWHDVPYDLEVIEGEGDHIALVEKPRYDESIMLTPEQFKKYNEEKERELLKISNSKEENVMFFKKEIKKVDNSKDLLEMSLVLPKSKLEKTVQQIINEADELALAPKKNEGEEMVKVGEQEMKLSELIEKYLELVAAKSEEKPENREDESEDIADGEVENSDEQEPKEEKAQNEEAKEDIKKAKNSKDNFKSLKDAHKVANSSVDEPVYESTAMKLQRGLKNY